MVIGFLNLVSVDAKERSVINGGCYYCVSQKKKHNDAKNFCKTKIVMGKMGKLAEPKTRVIKKVCLDRITHHIAMVMNFLYVNFE